MENVSEIFTIELASINLPVIDQEVRVTDKWVKYGVNDDYLEKVLDYYNDSPTNSSILKLKTNMIKGAGFTQDVPFNPKDKTGKKLLKRISRDYAIFEGFAIQLLKASGENKWSEVYPMDFSRVRAVPEETGDADMYLFSRNFKLHRRKAFQPVPMPLWDMDNGDQLPDRAILYFYEPHPGVDYYPIPSYNAAFSDIEFEYLYSLFKASAMKNGMFPTVHIKVTGNPDKGIKDAFFNKVKEKFSGVTGEKILITYSEQEEAHVEISPIETTGNADQFTQWKEDARQGIISAHQLTSPVLAGLSGSGNLSGNAEEINNAIDHFQNNYVQDRQENICDALKPVLEMLIDFTLEEDFAIKPIRPVNAIPEIVLDTMSDDEIREMANSKFDLGLEIDKTDEPDIDTEETEEPEEEPEAQEV